MMSYSYAAMLLRNVTKYHKDLISMLHEVEKTVDLGEIEANIEEFDKGIHEMIDAFCGAEEVDIEEGIYDDGYANQCPEDIYDDCDLCGLCTSEDEKLTCYK